MTLSIESAHLQKSEMRSLLKKRREAICPARRQEAKNALFSSLLPMIETYRFVLSFQSFDTEIETMALNSFLAKHGKLLLPRVSCESLLIYHVTDLSKNLIQSQGLLWEPDPSQCMPVEISSEDCILVPGLGFDGMRQRIGYGKGHYDQFLKKIKEHSCCPKSIGIGYREQLFEGCLPQEAHDIGLDSVLLF